MVTVKANGAGEVVSITIDPRAIDPDDPELLADLVLAAVNEALRSSAGADGGEDVRADARWARRSRRVAARLIATRRTEECPKATARLSCVLSPAVENLVTQLTKLPGIGRRTAQRLAFHILSAQPDDALELSRAIEDVKARVRFCNECGNLTEEELCAVCADARRDRTVICVVEQPVDVVSVERTGEYRGLYHVLGGALSPLDGVEPGDLRIDGLLARVERNGVTEVVLATNPTMTGEATAAYLADRLRETVQVTRLASGLPVGGDLEYADEVTLGRALSGRRAM